MPSKSPQRAQRKILWFCVLGALSGESSWTVAWPDGTSSTVILRHLLSIAILPFTVTVIIPSWLARRFHVTFTMPDDGDWRSSLLLLGAASLGVGLLLFAASLRQFAVRGKGTLAPWDPPKHLVVEGPYRYVRNPMISGVLFVLRQRGARTAIVAARVVGTALSRHQPDLHSPGRGAAARSAIRRVIRGLPASRPRAPAPPAPVAAG